MVLAVLVVAALSANGQHLELPWLCIHSGFEICPKGQLDVKELTQSKLRASHFENVGK